MCREEVQTTSILSMDLIHIYPTQEGSNHILSKQTGPSMRVCIHPGIPSSELPGFSRTRPTVVFIAGRGLPRDESSSGYGSSHAGIGCRERMC